MPATSPGDQQRRLRWQCRRGLLELDLIFNRFLSCGYERLTANERAAFEELLKQPDQTLLTWFQDGQEPPPHLKKIVNIML